MADSSSRIGRVVGSRQQRTGPLACVGVEVEVVVFLEGEKKKREKTGRSRFGSGDERRRLKAFCDGMVGRQKN